MASAALAPLGSAITHIFSVDVEEHFQVVALEPWVPRESWDSQPSRVERNTDILLELLARHQCQATFFTLGWIGRKYPGLIRRIVAGGHELASHGYSHRRVNRLTPAELLEELHSSKAILEAAGGCEVTGFRAPSFSIVPGVEWAFDALLEAGYRYDSSLFPIRRPDYGYPSAPPVPYLIKRPGGTLLEFPLATMSIGTLRLPAAGGGYFRQFPYGLTGRAFRQHARAGDAAMFYIHPWEIDPGQPRLPVSTLTRWRHYGNLDRTLPRLERLLSEFRFTSVARHFGIRPGLPGGAWAERLPA